MFYTSSADVADLIDHLSRDLDTSRGRIDIRSNPATAQPPPVPYSASDQGTTKIQTPNNQFEDVPSPQRGALAPMYPPKPSASVPAAGFSPRRQLFVRQGLSTSPGGANVASSGSGQVLRSVEDRLQALLDRSQENEAKPVKTQ